MKTCKKKVTVLKNNWIKNIMVVHVFNNKFKNK